MKNKIYLIGPMGSGKSTIGKLLSNKLKLPHYDLDKIIEIDQGMPISTIFQKYDEEYFRVLESIALEKYSKLNSFVISTGGGAILKEKNQKLLNNGYVVYLKISLNAQYERIKNRTHRPLLDKKDVKSELEILDNIRGKIYENVSNIEVDVSNLDKEDVLSSIINKL